VRGGGRGQAVGRAAKGRGGEGREGGPPGAGRQSRRAAGAAPHLPERGGRAARSGLESRQTREGGLRMPATMSVTTRQIGPCFAAEMEGLDLTKPLSPDEVAAVHAGMEKYAVLVFRDQPLTDDQHLAF